MMMVKYPISIVATFLWIGFVCAISFMEAWLKFRASGVTLPIGLGIGRLVFNALNKVEWIIGLVILINLIFSKDSVFNFQNTIYFVILIILITQTIWLLPALDSRAELHIQNQIVPASNLHFYYVGMEILKVICLTIFGILNFKNITI
jgi:hypothetical protein